MRLKDWIATLEAAPQTMRVVFDDGRHPMCLVSWRGSYDELTLDGRSPEEGAKPPTVATLLRDARAAVGATFTGYKGGDFVMREHTPVWADEWGDYGSRGIAGTAVEDGRLVVKTMDLGDYR